MLASYQFTWIKDNTPIDLSNKRIEVCIPRYSYSQLTCVFNFVLLCCYNYLLIIQITNNYTTSSFVINATDTNATLDNGVYNCQVTLTISRVDNFSEISNNSTVVFKGLFTLILHTYIIILATQVSCKCLILILCSYIHTYIYVSICTVHNLFNNIGNILGLYQ